MNNFYYNSYIGFLLRYAEAEAILTENVGNQGNTLDDIIVEYGEQACFVLMLLAKIATKTERKGRAIEAFKKALKLNPFMWSCFEQLCNLGDKPNLNNTFQLSSLENLVMCHGANLNNIESVIFQNTNTSKDQQIYVTTPQQIINNNLEQVTLNSAVCTPEESPLAQPLCMSGFALLPTTRVKPFKFRFMDSNSVSLQKVQELCFSKYI